MRCWFGYLLGVLTIPACSLLTVAVLAKAGRGRVSERHIEGLYKAVDDRLLPECRSDGFRPGEGIYRLGDYGAVTVDQWDQAMEQSGAPKDFALAYMLIGNGDLSCGELSRIPVADWTSELTRLLDDSDLEYVYYTEADEEGCA
ncbi:hypothetical protein CRD60_00985 [Bifidobacterium aemilianum]|uniref:Uncharacterized protein n=1 Tax=Bifidobacterium aemilianum TaxID=2493120 RepID=A0A366KCS6_9BIFI|nr:hypothetical protein [Bifidobacterium aemilianum]RBP98471.1 hypothetical protein CRD60_00985 [Bifidobacterium aemilianum]